MLRNLLLRQLRAACKTFKHWRLVNSNKHPTEVSYNCQHILHVLISAKSLHYIVGVSPVNAFNEFNPTVRNHFTIRAFLAAGLFPDYLEAVTDKLEHRLSR